MTEPQPSRDFERDTLARAVSAVLWPSFLLAAIATTVLFAFVDPVELHAISFPDWRFSRTAGYSIGFFMFWSVTCASSALTWLLLQPRTAVNGEQPR